VHEGVEGVVEGVHEVGVVDRGLSACEFGGEALIPVGEDVHVLVVVPGLEDVRCVQLVRVIRTTVPCDFSDKVSLEINLFVCILQSLVARNKALKDADEQIDFQTDFVTEIARDCGSDYPYELDTADIFKTWHHHKDVDILTYRDQRFASKFTGTQSPIHHTNFMYALDDSLDTFMHQTKK
jgi:hypothetical protein